MPVVPTAVERLLLLRLNRSPGALLDVFAAAGLDAVGVALELGVFDALADAPGTVPDLAARLDCDERGVEALLGVLAADGYVTRRGDTYRLTKMAARWVAPDAPESFGAYLQFWREVVLPFCREHAADAVRDGAPSETIYEWLDDHPERWPLAQRAFAAAARVVRDDIVAAVAPESGDSILDAGGGHGLFSIALCEAADGVTATVLDDPAALAVAEENVAEAGLGDSVTLVGGDYFDADYGTDRDIVVFANVFHAHDEAECRVLLERAATALGPGGRVAVLDQFDTNSRLPLARTAARTIDYTYFATLGGRVHDAGDVRAWLRDAGFEEIERSEFRAAGSTLLVASH